MDAQEFKKDFLESVRSTAAATGEGSSAAFTDSLAQYLVEAEVLPDFVPSFYKGKKGNRNYRVDGYVLDELDKTMNLVITDFDGIDEDRTLIKSVADRLLTQLTTFIEASWKTNLYREIEPSIPCSDLVNLLRESRSEIRKFCLYIFTDADMSALIKTLEVPDLEGIPVEAQIWDLNRLYKVCCSDQGRQIIEIDFRDYCDDGIQCLEANVSKHNPYRSYLAVIPGTVLADVYDKYGSRLLEGNVRSFLSTKVAVNKKIRSTILNEPQMFFAFNNGISATAFGVEIENTDKGRFITRARDFQIINGGQTTASISTARYKDKADLDEIYVQMKLTEIDGSTQEDTDELIRNISRSSNSQNKVSDADFFASHPFHRRMEQISRRIFAPAVSGAQYETKWFYERARGQYLQEQMRLTPAKKRQFELQNPKKKLIRKTDLAKVQNSWRGNPHIVSRGAQTNFNSFAEWIDEQWNKNDSQFNERYFQSTAALMLILHFLEERIPKQIWYAGGYRANIIYYTMALFRKLISDQYPSHDLDLMLIWNKQGVPVDIQDVLISLSEKVFRTITSEDRKVMNVTQWCKREECWKSVKQLSVALPEKIKDYLVSSEDSKEAEKEAKKNQKTVSDIDAQVQVTGIPGETWKQILDFSLSRSLVSPSDVNALKVACKIPNRIPDPKQSQKLLTVLSRVKEEGFNPGF